MRIKGGWKNKLTKKELKHLNKEANVHSLAAMIRTHKGQEKMRKGDKYNASLEPCWTCKGIARKLGLPIESDKRKEKLNEK